MVHTCHALRARRTQAVEWQYNPPNPVKRALQGYRSLLSLHFEGRALRRCRGAVMTVSQYLKDYVVTQHGLRDDEVFVTENGVDHGTFHRGLRAQHREAMRRELGIPSDAFVLLFVGGRWFDKGVPFLVEALGAMQDRGAHLVVVGKGDVEFFTRFASEHGVGDRVRFVPPTGETQRYYAMADCFGLPSDAEGFPLVIGEAASCGLPLILTPVGGAEHLVEEGVSGYIVPPDGKAIAQRCDALAADPQLLARMSDAVHEKACKLSWDKQAREVMDLLERLVPGGGREAQGSATGGGAT
jgi:UDP-glucose:(heptosyl)LPS alpha-1,3-glucosyltransferase